MRIWRAGDLLLPLRATSSCHRCRSKAGWRGRQALSGCGLKDSGFAGQVQRKCGQTAGFTGPHARRAAANPIGRNVKLADLADNCDLSSIAEPTEADYQRIERYRLAIKLIHSI